jgi:hypothetical protein
MLVRRRTGQHEPHKVGRPAAHDGPPSLRDSEPAMPAALSHSVTPRLRPQGRHAKGLSPAMGEKSAVDSCRPGAVPYTEARLTRSKLRSTGHFRRSGQVLEATPDLASRNERPSRSRSTEEECHAA